MECIECGCAMRDDGDNFRCKNPSCGKYEKPVVSIFGIPVSKGIDISINVVRIWDYCARAIDPIWKMLKEKGIIKERGPYEVVWDKEEGFLEIKFKLKVR